jgi:hypothetical protein
LHDFKIIILLSVIVVNFVLIKYSTQPHIKPAALPLFTLHPDTAAVGFDDLLGNRQVFTEDAIAMVCQFSKGIPRRINNLCRYALVAAIEADSPLVDAAAVQKGMDEAML